MKPQTWMYISVFVFCIAAVTGFYLVLGASVAPNGGLGAFGFMLWPFVTLMAIAIATQWAAIRGFKREQSQKNGIGN